MSLNPLVVAVGGLVVVLSLWAVDHSRLVRDAALESAGGLSAEVEKLTGHNNDLARELADRAELQQQLTEIGRATQALNSTLDGQTALINRNLSELKRNDKAITDYLGGLVPVALGLRYARPETTDPAAYRAAASGVQPGAVPPAGASAVGSH
jgi:hypothetical protein